MLRIVCVALLALSAVLFVAVDRAEPAGPAAPLAAGNTTAPVVVYSLRGGTLLGTVHTQLTVYNNGFATIAKMDDSVIFGQVEDVASAGVGPAAANKLLLDLVQNGAVTLPDQNTIIFDTPLTTLTILEGKQLGLSRTFSYFFGPEYSGVNQVIVDFIQTHFPGF